MSRLKTYYRLTKPGIIYGNSLPAIGGFLLASKGRVNFGLFVSTFVGLSLIIGSACALNNYINRSIDRHMARTKKRALVTGKISGRSALVFATMLGLLGASLLAVYTNWLAFGVALTGFFVYIVLYGVGKRHTVHGTLVGSIAGAVPPVVGYTAAAGQFDLGAGLLFATLALWQMPHFYAIAIRRADDYKAANIPVMPLKKGVRSTKIQILVYVAACTLAALSLSLFGYATSLTYVVIMLLAGAAWFWKGVKGFAVSDDKLWARSMFLSSLVVMVTFSFMISVDQWLP